MSRLNQLKETRAAKVAEMQGLVDGAGKANRDLAENEAQRFDALKREVRNLEAEIGRHEALADLERLAPAETIAGERRGSEIRSRYSVAKAVQESVNGRLTGIEAEQHQELSRGRTEVRGVMVPTDVLLSRESRSQTVGSDPAGGYTVQTNLQPLADRYRPALKVEAMGATVLRGLSGNVDIPKLAASGSTTWVNENGDATRSAASFAKAAMHPRTVTGEYQLSRRLILQSSAAIEDLLRRDLGFLLAQALDKAAINGSGVNDPLGILQTSGVTKVTTATFFGDTCADLMAELDIDDVTGSRAFLTNTKVIQAARKLKDGDGHIFPMSELFHDERVEVTTQVPANIGSGSNKSALIYGQWSELVLGYWSGVDILANPYHADVASNGGVLLHAFLDADVAVRHTEAFAYAEI